MKRTVDLSRPVPQVKLSKAYKIDTDVSARLYCKEIRMLVNSPSVEENSQTHLYSGLCFCGVENAAVCLVVLSWFILFGSQQAKPILNTVSPC